MLLPRARDSRVRRALLAAALAGVAARVRAHDAGGGTLHVVADPPQVVLGHEAGADLRIAAPADAEDLTLSTNAGRVEDVRRLPAGGFTARWVAPSNRIPQVAIIAAIARTPRGAADGWIAIPCAGQADARVRAVPGAEITLTIGGRRFGPRTAGSDGVAVIPIVVPPGVREAHHGFKPIDLKVPETPLLHATLDRAVVLADRPERVRVLTWVVAPHGAARRGDAPVFEVTRGTVAVSEHQPGVVEAIWTVPPGRAGEERIVVRLGWSPVSRTVLRIQTAVGPPAVVAVSFDGTGAVAGAEEGTAVAVRALDAGGNPVAATLAIEAEGASLSDVRQPEPGLLLARLRAPASLKGRTEAIVRASAPEAGVSGTRRVPLLAGAPALAEVEPSRAVIRGGRELVLLLRVSDLGGNPVGRDPSVSADTGKVVSLQGVGPGAWRVRWAAPVVAAPLRARLSASLAGVQAVAEPWVLPPRPPAMILASAGFARDLRGRWSGPRGGVALELPLDTATPAGLELAWRAEVEGTRTGRGPSAAILGGASASYALGSTLVVRATASLGPMIMGDEAAPAARVGVDMGLGGRGIAPFFEAALLGASRGGPGAFAAVTVSAGIRLSREKR